MLSGEENFNGYFRTAGTSAADKRYGLTDRATARGWEQIDPRFDARNPGYENEPNRFGWIVEVDPLHPEEAPVKHTALGRFKHEGANVIVGKSGHVAAYMGDDERFDYLYKFVSSGHLPQRCEREGAAEQQAAADGRQPLRRALHRQLPVWRRSPAREPCRPTGCSTAPASGFRSSWTVPARSPGFTTEQVLVNTRLAADAVGATKMDRCEDVEPHPTTGRVYVACTNNTDRGDVGKEGATEVNPRNSNRDGHIVEITEAAGDATATTFGWSLLLVCGDPAVSTVDLLRRLPCRQGLADLLPRQRRLRLRRQPVDLHRRSTEHDRLLRRPLQGAA